MMMMMMLSHKRNGHDRARDPFCGLFTGQCTDCMMQMCCLHSQSHEERCQKWCNQAIAVAKSIGTNEVPVEAHEYSTSLLLIRDDLIVHSSVIGCRLPGKYCLGTAN